MSFSLQITLTCDGCGKLLATALRRGTSDGYADARSELEYKFIRPNGIIEEQTFRRQTRHFCLQCADKPTPKRINKVPQ